MKITVEQWLAYALDCEELGLRCPKGDPFRQRMEKEIAYALEQAAILEKGVK